MIVELAFLSRTFAENAASGIVPDVMDAPDITGGEMYVLIPYIV